ncbi:hypothetical protein V6N13_046382 [Hibiscus sabdariffa]|uniref:Uncharacterized protein n=1 Tax=Hibiscus sabdariffa TaxID=183260 RepID=A0ABR2D9Z9_9ROSI
MPSGLQSDEESPRAFFSELPDGNITRKPKRYGSLWDFQEKELSGRSLSDSDLSTWRNILTKEAKKTLKL